MQDKSIKLTIPTLIMTISTLLSGLFYIYSMDKRLSLVEQNIVHIEQDKIELEKQVEQNNAQQDARQIRLENKIDKIYDILVQKHETKK